MKVWTIANQKGGVGKTTSAASLAGLASESNLRVLLLDIDPHASLTSYFKMVESSAYKNVFQLFDNKNNLTEKNIRQQICQTQFKNIHLIPSSMALATLERKAIGEGMGLVLKETLMCLYEEYDLVLIDCPPQLGVLMVNALAACDHVIIPVQTEFLAIKGLERMLRTLSMLDRSRKNHLNYTIVPTMYDRRTQASVTSLRTIRHDFGEDVWPGKIVIDTRFRDASKSGAPPHIYDAHSRGVECYRSLYKVLNKKTEYIESLYLQQRSAV